MSEGKGLLINGSPRGQISASYEMGTFLSNELSDKNVDVELKHISEYEGNDNIITDVNKVDIIVFICPLYVDSLPSQVICLMEELEKKKDRISEGKGFAIFLSSGFPERAHSAVALKMAEIFSKKVGFQWLSGSALGGGGIIYGKPIDKEKKVTMNIAEALHEAADYISRIKPIPAYVDDLMNKKKISDDAYVKMTTVYFKKKLKENGIKNKLNGRPYKR